MHRTLIGAVGVVMIVAFGACGAESQGPGQETTLAPDQGVMVLSLVSTNQDGHQFRLAGANFQIAPVDATGTTTGAAQTVSANDSDTASTIKVGLVAGRYEVKLASGWAVKYLDGNANPTVPARLLSVNPVGVWLTAGGTSVVKFDLVATLPSNSQSQAGDPGISFAVSERPFAVQVVAGYDHTCERLADGGVRCWGRNNVKQSANSTDATVLAPTKVALPDGLAAALIDAQADSSCALLVDGSVACWGSFGGTTAVGTPARVPGLVDVANIAVGNGFVVAATNEGTVLTWKGGTTAATLVAGLEHMRVVRVGAGHNGKCALTDTGYLFYWDNFATSSSATNPVTILATGIAAFHAEDDTLCYRPAGATTMRCVGDISNTAVPAGLLGTSVGLENGDSLCYVQSASVIKCDSTIVANPITADASLGSVSELAAGGTHICARYDSGFVDCWGTNTYGQLGVGY